MILFNSLRTNKMFHLVQKQLQRAQIYRQSEIVKKICFIDPKLLLPEKRKRNQLYHQSKTVNLHV